MRFDTKPHQLYCGIDLHARTMDVCLLDREGEIGVHRHLTASPDALLKVVAPDREDSVVAVACLFTWAWLADRWAQAEIPFVRGHALSMTAIPGGQAQHAPIEAHKIAVLRRGGMRPQASV